mmetsp:Transcript_24614/g.34740  ORF Transcript_24614/g.34740 Transcript_24614/m.34740 type:complete len:415 (+) Transcript_24614:103-1347(+)
MTLIQYILPITFGVVTLSTAVTLFGFTVHNHNKCRRFDEYGYCEEEEEQDDEGNNRRDEDPEVAQLRKLEFAMMWVMVASLTLAVLGFFTWWKKTGTAFRIGTLGGSTVMMVNMAVVCILYFWSFRPEEEDENNNNNNNNNRYLPEDDNEVILQDEHTFAVISIWLAAIFAVLSIFVLRSHNKEADTAEEQDSEKEAEETLIKGKAYADILSDIWTGISVISIVPFIVILCVAFVPLFDEDEGERVREEGYIWNLIYLSFWMIAVVIVTIVMGRRVLGGKGCQVQLGVFTGGLLFFAASEFLLAVLYGSFQIDERRREDRNALGSTGFAYVCMFLALIHGLFSIGMFKYGQSMIQALTTNDGAAASGFTFERMMFWKKNKASTTGDEENAFSYKDASDDDSATPSTDKYESAAN